MIRNEFKQEYMVITKSQEIIQIAINTNHKVVTRKQSYESGNKPF